MSGSIQNTYTLIPQYRGKYPIPPINFSYFDPSSKTYKKVSTKEISIDVINGPIHKMRENKTILEIILIMKIIKQQ